VLELVLVLVLVPHSQVQLNLQLTAVPAKLTLSSCSPVNLLLKFGKAIYTKIFLLKAITSFIVFLGIHPSL